MEDDFNYGLEPAEEKLCDAKQLYETVGKKIELGERLKKKLDTFRDIDGALKIQRKINQELKFLEKVCNTRANMKR